MVEFLEPRRLLSAAFPEFVDPHPNSGNEFGKEVVKLSTGNVVITSPYDDAGGTDAGAVYLFDGATGALISTLTGSHASDNVGVIQAANAVTALSNGNFVVCSPGWDNGTVTDAGAVTWGSGTTGVSGVISAANSLVGSTAGDQVGGGASGHNAVTVLNNGNYVVDSFNWSNGTAANVGAVTWSSGTTGVSGIISAANSLVGETAGDQIGEGRFTSVEALSTGNYVVCSSYWNNGTITHAGAVTWASGTTGISGFVSSANSLVGATDYDEVGIGGITVLTNGNYVVNSQLWKNGGVKFTGAETWGSGTTGISGFISAANSLVGTTYGDEVAKLSASALSNGNYLVVTPTWNNGTATKAGAVTWGNGTTGISGVISAANSLVGSSKNDQVGVTSGAKYKFGAGTATDIWPLSNGNYVVVSSEWNNGAIIGAGAVTWGSGTTGICGTISASNSLIGTTSQDNIANGGVTPLSNGNYVVSSGWSNGAITNAGAVTWGSGTTGICGTISASNSLIGTTSQDKIGNGGVTPLSNGDYAVKSPYWNNGAATDAGAVTYGSGTTGTTGSISASNSLVGSTANDMVGNGEVKELSNGNYVVESFNWSGSAANVGAVTYCSGPAGFIGTVSASNSLVGSTANDEVGSDGVTVLSNGNYVVSSNTWDNGTVANAGAVTFGDGTTGIIGTVSASNSLVGSTANDSVGSIGDVTALTNGNYVVSSTDWSNMAATQAGAVTWGSAIIGVSGVISAANSLVGSLTNDHVGSRVTALSNGNFTVENDDWNSGAGALTWSRGDVAATTGTISSTNSAIGTASGANLQSVIVDGIHNTFYGSFLSDGGGRVHVGSQSSGFANAPPVLGTAGSISYTENASARVIDPGITVSDEDDATLTNARIAITNFVSGQDVLSFTNDGSTMGNIAVQSNSSGVLTLLSSGSTATKAEWQNALRVVKYFNSSDNPSTTRRSVDFNVFDGKTYGIKVTSTIFVTAVNDVPVALISSVSTNETTAKTFSVSDFKFSDAESNSLVSIKISNLSLANGDTLKVNQGAGAVVVTNGMTITAAQIATLTYNPAAQTYGTARTTFSFTVNDAGTGTIAATMSVNVIQVFAYIAATLPFEAIDLEAGQSGVFTIVDDVDDGSAAVNLGANTFNFYGTTYTGTQLFASSNGLISFGTGYDGSFIYNLSTSPSGAVIAPLWHDWRTDLNASDSVLGKFDGNRLIIEWNQIQSYPSSPSPVTFQAILQLNTAGTPGDIVFNYVDTLAGNSADNGLTSTVGIKPINGDVSPAVLVSYNTSNSLVGSGEAIRISVNSLPVAQDSSVTTNEDTAKTFTASDFHFTDIESNPLASITINSLSLASSDTLTVDQGAGLVTVTNGMTITATQISTLTYTPASDANGTARSSFAFKVNDSGAGIVAATMTINVTAVNDVPVAQASSVTTNEDTAKRFATSDFAFTDIENNPLASVTISNLSLASGDKLTVDQGAGAVAVTNGMTITAAQTPTLTYTPASNAIGTARGTFSFTVNDAGIGTISATMSVNVVQVFDYIATAQPVEAIDLEAGQSGVFTILDNADDGTAAVNLGANTFNFYGTTYSGTQLFASSNGLISFDNGYGSPFITDLSTSPTSPSGAVIAPLWNDWRTDLNASDAVLGKFDGNRLIIEWSQIQSYPNSPSPVTFQAILQLNTADTPGNIIFNYVDTLAGNSADNGVTSTVGIKPSNGDVSPTVLVSYNASNSLVGSGKAIRISVNSLPVAEDSSVTTNEDTAKTFAASDFQFTDVESDALASITIGGVTLAHGDTLTVDQGAGAVPVVFGMTITAAQIPTLTYTPAADANGTARSSFAFIVNDSGAGMVAATMTINVTAVNDVPVAQASSVTTNEDTAKTFAASDFTFTDVENNPLASVSISNLSLASGDKLTVDQGAGAVAVTNGMTITAAQIPTLTYTPASNANGSARSRFDFTVNDMGNGIVGATMTINVTAVNDVPVAQASSVTTNEDTPKTFAISDFQFTDVESNALTSITVSSLSLNSGDTLTLTGVPVTINQTIAASQIPLLTYTPASNANSAARSSFDFTVNDMGSGIVVATMTINVTAVNDVPVAQASSVTTNEDTPKTFAISDFHFTDVESNALTSITISSLSLAGGDALRLSGTPVTVNQTITAAQIPLLTYSPASNTNGSARSSFGFMVNDVGSGTVAATMKMNVTAVNDVPVGTSGTVTGIQNTAYIFKATDFGFTDPNDSPANTLLAVKFAVLPTAGSIADNGVPITINQFVNAADVSGGKLKFTPNPNLTGGPFLLSRFQVEDNGGTTNGGLNLDPNLKQLYINIAHLNHAPVGTSGTVTGMEKTAYTFKAADFGFTDPNDSPANTLLAVKFAVLPTAGTITDNGTAITINQFVSAADVNGGKLKFTPNPNLTGGPFLLARFQVEDNGGTANGGLNLDSNLKQVYVNLKHQNHAPVGAAHTVTMLKNTTYTFKVADFGFSDPNDGPPNTLVAVMVTTTPPLGSLTDNGVKVVAGQKISLADVTNGKLKFTPAANGTGGTYASFTFQVQDNGGTANGGIDTDPAPKKLTISVT